ncbi:outer membrane lipoprotein carrier protein LolA [Candidatus Ruthia magnifica str. Cm (Calyptogena magnifica)]|uniref:Outer membrane lipoprotein carrier protein LolA n=1 Tax=Ruthia magnifica subsp. Calyptogena magnifica TaxID=413404 RepID=A1AV88_RUTMC|nr:outer-membrane lipoprotein carrier protein LolA [Candidatus Ruthturnera calyptogenae]ABL01845.1 outer membrane lipoprotein carrier protein LolA [Candidatus Ruthia magnifica str. Cm (Calyptogena magnifica)]
MTNFLSTLILIFSNFSFANSNHGFSNFFNSFERLSANFTQITYSNTGTLLASSSGTLLFKRPQQLIWHTLIPNERILLLNNTELWLIDIELEQASLIQATNLTQTPLYWLISQPSDISHTPQYTHTKDKIDWYSTQQANQLSFGFKDDVLQAITFNNKLDQTILVNFDSISINPNIKINAFELNLAPEFDVLR